MGMMTAQQNWHCDSFCNLDLTSSDLASTNNQMPSTGNAINQNMACLFGLPPRPVPENSRKGDLRKVDNATLVVLLCIWRPGILRSLMADLIPMDADKCLSARFDSPQHCFMSLWTQQKLLTPPVSVRMRTHAVRQTCNCARLITYVQVKK